MRNYGAYVGPATHLDTDLYAIVEAVCKKFYVAPTDALGAFAKYLFQKLVEQYLVFLEGVGHPRTLMESIYSIVYVEARKLMREVNPPSLICRDLEPDKIAHEREPKWKLCDLFVWLIDRVSNYFRFLITVEETSYVRDGSDVYQFTLTFSKKEDLAT